LEFSFSMFYNLHESYWKPPAILFGIIILGLDFDRVVLTILGLFVLNGTFFGSCWSSWLDEGSLLSKVILLFDRVFSLSRSDSCLNMYWL
jgi:hypothetical protein